MSEASCVACENLRTEAKIADRNPAGDAPSARYDGALAWRWMVSSRACSSLNDPSTGLSVIDGDDRNPGRGRSYQI